MESVSLRDFFDELRGKAAPIRPPFSKFELTFTDICTTCDNCVRSCPERILVRGRGGYPQVDFSKGSCTFCAACADVCKVDAFRETRDVGDAWPVRAQVAKTCLENQGISCRACKSSCETRAIRFRPTLGGRTDIMIDQSLCTGCGACLAPCPQGAITIVQPKQTTPEKLEAIA